MYHDFFYDDDDDDDDLRLFWSIWLEETKKSMNARKFVKTSHFLISFTERSNTHKNITHYRQGNYVCKNLNVHKTQYYLYIAAGNK